MRGAAARWVAFGVVALAATSWGAQAAAAPTVMPGWPVAVPAGVVLTGPSGGAVVVGANNAAQTQDRPVVALRRTGARLWLAVRAPGCGNCDDGPHVESLQPDGTYGPIGDEGDDLWAVDARGRIVPGCAGAVLDDGTCIRTVVSFSPTDSRPLLVVEAEGGESTPWTHEEPGLRLDEPGEVPEVVVVDGDGVAYVAHGPGTVAGVRTAGGLLALDARTGAVLGRRPGAHVVLAALPSGVLTRAGGAVTVVESDGVARWSRAVSGGVSDAPAIVDGPRHRIYLGTGGATPGVVALDTRTGTRAWRRAGGSPVAAMRAGALVAVSKGTRRGLVALDLRGRERWTFPTATPVAGAVELPDGTVVLSTRALVGRQGGLAIRIRPGRDVAPPRAPSVSLSRARVSADCPPGPCDVNGRFGTILSVSFPRATALRVALLRSDGRPDSDLITGALRFTVPEGRSFVRLLLGEPRLRAGARTLEVSWSQGGRREVRRLPITIR